MNRVIVQATPEVVGSLPPTEEFTGPVYNPFHQEHFSAGVTTENIAEIPVVQEQVLVQAIPRVVGSLPPVEEFTAYVARRPSPLVEVRPSVRVQRHVVEHLADIAPMVQILGRSCAADGGAGYRSAQDVHRLPAALARFSPCRSQRNSWWKCRPS